jgi:hypothetical protein
MHELRLIQKPMHELRLTVVQVHAFVFVFFSHIKTKAKLKSFHKINHHLTI